MRFRLAPPVLALALSVACTRPPSTPDSSSTTTQQLPFDRQPSASGLSPSESLVPTPHQVPEGTSITVRLTKLLSSAEANAGDSFEGTLDDPVVVDEQTLLPRGAHLTGRVLDARHSAGPASPGYLRITLLTVQANGKSFPIETSSIFAKAASRPQHPSGTSMPPSVSRDVNFTPERRLTFRLAQALDLE